MPLLAANGVPVTQSWGPRATFRWPYGRQGAIKLDAFVNGTDVVVQVLEDPESGWQEDQSLEILLRLGFNSREFTTPIHGWRFKVWSGTLLGTTGSVDMVALN